MKQHAAGEAMEGFENHFNMTEKETAETAKQEPETETAKQEPKAETAKREPEAETAKQEPETEMMKKSEGKKKYGRSSFFHPADGLAIAFWIPVVIMVIIFIQRKIFPFGEECFLRTDMYHQYAPFFSEFQYKLKHGGSLLYSWDVGMGVNFSALYAYYLASPFNWLILLCPNHYVIEFMTISVVLKIGLSGMAFAWYLQKHSRMYGDLERGSVGAGLFGIFYALSGYMAAYSWNIMWLDCIVLLPVIMLGLERLVHKKKWGLYCLALGASILSNYYISIVICIFMTLYFVALLILEKRKPLKDYGINILEFGVCSLLAGGLAAAVLIPEIYALQMTAAGEFSFPKTFNAYFSILDMLARHIGNVEVEIGLDHWPNIYCGVGILMLFLLYLGSKKIRIREKAVYCTLILLFLASFSVNVLNFIWHGFHYPNSLPCRQSFIYIALMLLVCYRAYCMLEDVPWKHVVIAFWGAVIFVLMAQEFVDNSQFHFTVFYVAILFLALYTGIIYLWKHRLAGTNLALLLALATVSIEAAVNTTVTSVTTTSRTSYTQDQEAVHALVETLYPSDGFFRIEKVTRKTKNDGAWMNFPSVSLFSSTANADLTDLFKKLGCEASTNAYSITGSTPLVDALFSVRYGLYSQEQENPMLSFLDHSGDIWLYERNHVLPLGIGVPFGFTEQWQTDMGNPALVQNDLCDIAGTPHVLEEVWGVEDGGMFRFTAEQDGEYYVYVNNKKVEKVRIDWGEQARTYDNVDRGYFLELGYMKAGEEVILTSEDDKSQRINGNVYRVSEEALDAFVSRLGEEPWNLTVWTDTKLEGTIEMAEAGNLFTTIPYDKGWTVRLDGQKMTSVKLANAFLGIAVPAGKHTIVMTYEPQGLRLGTVLTAASVLILFIWVWMARKKMAGRRMRLNNARMGQEDETEKEADEIEADIGEMEYEADEVEEDISEMEYETDEMETDKIKCEEFRAENRRRKRRDES